MYTKDKKQQPAEQYHLNKHWAIHEDIHLARTRNSSDKPDDKADEQNEKTARNNSIVVTAGKVHPGYH